MGILIFDIQQTMIANLAMQLTGRYSQEIAEKTDKGLAVNEGLLRHMILNSIRFNRNKFPEYKDVVIACDGYSWRRQAFKYYKASRKTTRDASSINWDEIFKSFATIRHELKTYFPYRTIYVERAEADDIIAQVVYHESTKNASPIMILSGDKDFKQLQTFKNVRQWDPTRKKFVTEDDPKGFLAEHIITGEQGDGIPNIISDDDYYVNPEKRTRLTKKHISEIKQKIAVGMLDKELETNYNRNRTLIDLRCCPKDLAKEIITDYESQAGKTRARLFTYFVKNKLTNLMENIQEF